MDSLIESIERGRLPDGLVRLGIRHLLRGRLREQRRRWAGAAPGTTIAEGSRDLPIAVETGSANRQHYEVPVDLFRAMLGPRLKYSACLWEAGTDTLAEAEEAMLDTTCHRVGIADGMTVLDLGCGWGSFGLWVAERHAGCRVLCVSNSASQVEHVRREAARRGLGGVEARRADVNSFEPGARFDRVVSVEMFEHVRNHGPLLERIAGWLNPDGRLFVHHFCHRRYAYFYEDESRSDWMARTFFRGGMMPSADLLSHHDSHLRVAERWTVAGGHYEKTLRAWLDNLDRGRDALRPVLGAHYGAADADLWFGRWRLFLLACAELFGYRGGSEWFVAHLLLEPSTGATKR